VPKYRHLIARVWIWDDGERAGHAAEVMGVLLRRAGPGLEGEMGLMLPCEAGRFTEADLAAHVACVHLLVKKDSRAGAPEL
jgi:hypothetical protein